MVQPSAGDATGHVARSKDAMHYDYFLNVAVPAMKLFDLHSSWLDKVVSLSISDECLKSCTIAFAAAHRSRSQYLQRAISSNEVAMRSLPSYNCAITLMRSQLAQTATPGPVIWLSYTLCTMTEFLFGHQESILVHLHFFAAFDAQSQSTLVKTRDETLEILAHFEFLNMLYGQPSADHLTDRRVLETTTAWQPWESLDDLSRLQKTCEHLCRKTLAFIRSAENGWFHTEEETQAFAVWLRCRLRVFRLQLGDFRYSLNDTSASEERWLASLLRAQVTTAEALFQHLPGSLEALTEDDIATFESALDNIEDVLRVKVPADASCSPPVMSLGTSLIAMLTMIGVYCPTESARARVTALLRRCPRVEAIWDAEVAQAIIAYLVKLEAHTGQPSLRLQVEQHGLDSVTVTVQQPSGVVSKRLTIGEL